MTTTKLNRAGLLQLALDGKVKAGDKFKDERGDTVLFTGSEFTWSSGMSLKLMVHGSEEFTPVFVDKDVAITLKQSEINALEIVLGKSAYSNTEASATRRNIPIPTSGDYQRLYSRLSGLATK